MDIVKAAVFEQRDCVEESAKRGDQESLITET
jgi:hypothetical protein